MGEVLTKEEREWLDDLLPTGGHASQIIDRLCVEVTRAKHENDRLEASIRCNVIKIGEKHRENDALRAELGGKTLLLDEAFARVEKLEKVASAAKSFADEVQLQFGGTCIPAEIDTLNAALSALRSEK